MAVINCQARATLVRVDLPDNEGHLLIFKHEGKHSCEPLDKKGKAVISEATYDAIKKSLPVFGGRMASEKLKATATTAAFEKMLSDTDGSPLDVYKVARELQDIRAVRTAMTALREGQRAPSKEGEEELKEMKRILDAKGYRVFLFDRSPLNWFMCPLDLPWCPAKVMLLMDRVLGVPPFIGCYACSDGIHSTINGRVVEKIGACIPGIGLIKLATFVLPLGERGLDEAQMWFAVDSACRTYALEDPAFERFRDKEAWVHTNPKGQIVFRPAGYIRDEGGGGWIGLRENYNSFMPLAMRRKWPIRDERGKSLEKGCGLHLIVNMVKHAQTMDKHFEGEQFTTLFTRFIGSQSSHRTLLARDRVYDFIAEQERKDVQDALMSLVTFYEGEGERSLQLFVQRQGANSAEALGSKDNKLVGVNLPQTEFLHLENVTYILQSAFLEHTGQGGYTERDSRTNVLYEERRKVLSAIQRGRHSAYDLMEQVRALPLQVPSYCYAFGIGEVTVRRRYICRCAIFTSHRRLQ